MNFILRLHVISLFNIFILLSACKLNNKPEIVVKYAISPSCPMTAFYLPKFDSIEKAHTRTIRFEYIISAKSHSQNEIDSFIQVLGSQKNKIIDKENKLLYALNTEVVPSVYVYKNNQLQYHGAIDNWAFAPMKLRQQVTEKYLEVAIKDLLSNKKVRIQYAKPVGCIVE